MRARDDAENRAARTVADDLKTRVAIVSVRTQAVRRILPPLEQGEVTRLKHAPWSQSRRIRPTPSSSAARSRAVQRCCSTAPTPAWWPSGRPSWPRRLPSATSPPGEILRLDDANLEDDPDRIYVELQTAPDVRRPQGRARRGRPAGDGRAAEAAGRGRRICRATLIVEAGNLRPDDALRALFEKSPRGRRGRLLPGRGARSRSRHPRGVRGRPRCRSRRKPSGCCWRGSAPTARCRGRRSTSSRSMRTARAMIEESDVEAAVGDAAELALDRIVMAAASGRPPAALAECDRSVASRRERRRPSSPPCSATSCACTACAARSTPAARWTTSCARCARRRTSSSARRSSSSAAAGRLPKLNAALARIAEAAKAARLNSALEGTLAENLLLDLGRSPAAKTVGCVKRSARRSGSVLGHRGRSTQPTRCL